MRAVWKSFASLSYRTLSTISFLAALIAESTTLSRSCFESICSCFNTSRIAAFWSSAS